MHTVGFPRRTKSPAVALTDARDAILALLCTLRAAGPPRPPPARGMICSVADRAWGHADETRGFLGLVGARDDHRRDTRRAELAGLFGHDLGDQAPPPPHSCAHDRL